MFCSRSVVLKSILRSNKFSLFGLRKLMIWNSARYFVGVATVVSAVAVTVAAASAAAAALNARLILFSAAFRIRTAFP